MAVTADTLRNVPLFAGLPERDLEHLAATMRDRTYSEGAAVTAEGGRGSWFFVIETGDADVVVDGNKVGSLSAGDYFGEIALIDDGTRTASVIAATDLRCWVLPPWEFRPWVKENPEVAWALLETLARRLRSAEQRVD
jgi:CRP/FNR family transcriptional regulator, cyclic AMP receptor protein